jgi:hypothetical protein
MDIYRGAVGLGAVGDHDLHPPAPAPSLGDEEARQGDLVAVGDHREDFAGLAVLQDRDVAVPAAHRGLVNQQDTAAARPAVFADLRRPAGHERHDGRPPQTVTASDRTDRHHPRIRHECSGEAVGETTFELVMNLEVALPAVGAREPAALPHQRDRPARHRQISDLAGAGVVNVPAHEPTIRATRPRTRRRDRHDQRVDRVREHREHADQPQMQPHLHTVGSHPGPPWIDVEQHRFQRGPDPHRWTPTSPSSHNHAQRRSSAVRANLSNARPTHSCAADVGGLHRGLGLLV